MDFYFALWTILSALLALLMWLSNRRERYWDHKQDMRRASRFTLEVQVLGPPDRTVCLGTSVVGGRRRAGASLVTYETIESGLDEQSSLKSERLQTVTRSGGELTIPQGTTLLAPPPKWSLGEEVTRALVESLDPDVSSEGERFPKARYDYCVPGGTWFWILDAPALDGQRATYRTTETELPPRPGGYEISFLGPPDPELESPFVVRWPFAVFAAVFVAALIALLSPPTWATALHVVLGIALVVPVGRLLLHHLETSMTKDMVKDAEHGDAGEDVSAHLELPLFLHGMQSPDWVVPKKRDELTVVCLDLSIVDDELASEERSDLFHAVCLLLTESIMLRTDVKAISSIPIDVGKSVRTRSTPLTWMSMPRDVRSLEGRHLVVWGEAGVGPSRDEVVLSVCSTTGSPHLPLAFRGSVHDVIDEVLTWMREHEHARKTKPRSPDFKRLGGGAELVRYASALIAVRDQVLAWNGAIVPLERGTHHAALDEAAALHFATGSLQTALLYLTSAIYAFRSDALPQHHRDQALNLIATAESGTVLVRLAPVIREALEKTDAVTSAG